MIIINKYLWDLNIETLPLAWDNIYNDAIENYPKGTFIEVDSLMENNVEVFADPIICRKLLVENFNKYSKLSNKTLNNLGKNFKKDDFNLLVKYDSILYTILSYWLDDLLDITSMDPKDFISELLDSSMDHYLYTLTNPNPKLEFIDFYRLLKL